MYEKLFLTRNPRFLDYVWRLVGPVMPVTQCKNLHSPTTATAVATAALHDSDSFDRLRSVCHLLRVISQIILAIPNVSPLSIHTKCDLSHLSVQYRTPLNSSYRRRRRSATAAADKYLAYGALDSIAQ